MGGDQGLVGGLGVRLEPLVGGGSGGRKGRRARFGGPRGLMGGGGGSRGFAGRFPGDVLGACRGFRGHAGNAATDVRRPGTPVQPPRPRLGRPMSPAPCPPKAPRLGRYAPSSGSSSRWFHASPMPRVARYGYEGVSKAWYDEESTLDARLPRMSLPPKQIATSPHWARRGGGGGDASAEGGRGAGRFGAVSRGVVGPAAGAKQAAGNKHTPRCPSARRHASPKAGKPGCRKARMPART